MKSIMDVSSYGNVASITRNGWVSGIRRKGRTLPSVVSVIVYRGLWVLVNAVARLGFRLRVTGRPLIPRQGGIIVAANHASYLDIPLVGCALPRRASFLGRASLFPNTLANRLLQWVGWIPIRIDRLDRKGFGEAVARLKAGQVVVIYPEGRRTTNGDLQPAKPGIGYIVAETGCPVVPAYISGTYEAWPRGSKRVRFSPVSITFGEPMDFRPECNRETGKALYHSISSAVMERIADLGRRSPPTRSSSSEADRAVFQS